MASLLVGLMLLGLTTGSTGLDPTALMQIGVIPTNVRQLMYYTEASSSYIVVKLMPTIDSPISGCNISSIASYNSTITKLLQPIGENLETIKSQLVPTRRRRRFAGVVIGLAALGVATAAQVTAAIALVKANENTAAILNLKASIQKTNAAVADVVQATQSLGTAVQAVQDHLNNVVSPAITAANCKAQDAIIGSILNMYLTELTTIFHNQITNPALTPITIQALRILLGSTLPTVVEKAFNTQISAAELLSSGLLTGQIVGLDLSYMQMVIKVDLPTLTTQPATQIVDLATISAFINNQEVMAQLPTRIMVTGGLIQSYPASQCTITPSTVYCRYNDAQVLSEDTVACLQGNLTRCTFSPVVGSFMTRFVLFDGIVYANCRSMLCTCMQPASVILQPNSSPITVIDMYKCVSLQLDNLRFTITQIANATYNSTIKLSASQILPIDPLDISQNLAAVNKSLNSALQNLAQSENYLSAITSANTTSILAIIALCIGILGLLLVILIAVVIWKLVSIVSTERTRMDNYVYHNQAFQQSQLDLNKP
ncbi:fusion protein [Alston virus]|uniref:Fusion glycoprotein F0 n=1 Tax=Alston virus TaxID=2495433 RepID=A0A3Q8S5Q1_9MONO|nr:fusion protein [Alston virus]AZK31327.1 fusion protein [Alston virus]